MTTTSATCSGPLVESLTRSIAALRTGAPGTGAGDWTPTDRETVIAALDAAVQDLTVYRGQVLLAHKQAGRWGSVSDRDFVDYRSRQTGAGRGAALGDLRLAEGLDAMPAVAKAVEQGDLTLEHAKTLTTLHDKASPEVKDALAGGGLESLVERAAGGQLSAPDLGKEARAWAAKIDAAAAQAEFDAVHRRRSLTIRKHAGGVTGEFFLDPVAGEQVRTALEAITATPAKDDERSREQRLADALTTMAGRTLQVGADLVGAQVRPHLSLLVTEQTWVGILARRRTFETCPTGPRPPWPNVPPAQLEDGTLVPVGELERLICDSELTRIVMTATGVPLDVGRTQRTYTKELRRAVMTRDRHCQWPDCRMRASWSEVHHITWFSRGGTTSLSEGICLCSYHHHLVHRLEVRITPLPDGFDFHHPDSTHIGTTRRQPPDTLLPCASTGAGQPAAGDRVSETRPLPNGTRGESSQPPTQPPRGRPSRPPSSGNGTVLPPARSSDVNVLPPPRPGKIAGPAAASRSGPLPSHPSTYASAPATLWGLDPPF